MPAVAETAGALVAPAVTKKKFDNELDLWDANADAYRRRGWVMVERGPLHVDVAFTAKLTLFGQVADIVCSTVRIEFTNYDVWAPSVTFIDIASGQPWVPPMRAIAHTTEGPRDLLIDQHPLTGAPFLCVPGTREYHTHPQHTGDEWLLHRSSGAGRLASLCDLLWRTTAQTLVGLHAMIQTNPQGMNVQLQIAQGDPAAIHANPAQLGPA